MTLAGISRSIILAHGWRRTTIAFAAGAALTLTLAPLHLWPIGFVSFSVLVWLIDGSAAGRFGGLIAAAGAGFWFGFGYFFAGLYWLGSAFLVDASTFAWLMPFGVLAFPAALAIFPAAGAALAWRLWRPGDSRVLALAFALTLAEYARGTLLSGFPWNTFGYALTGPLVLAQSASVFGLWGLTFIAVFVFAAPTTAIDDRKHTLRPFLLSGVALAILIALAAFGAWRLSMTPTNFVGDVKLRIMQPNLAQDVKFNYAAKQQVMDHYVALSSRSESGISLQDVTHLIWPESAFPFFLAREPDALAQIARLLPKGVILITGGVRSELPSAAEPRGQFFNSIYAVDHEGSIISAYDKVHLVPFGEYLPLQRALESIGLQPLTKVIGGFSAGHRRRVMEVPDAPPFIPLICYEIIFPGQAVPRDLRPDWLLNVSNDGWFGKTAGPHQHLAQARIRAIEEGLPLVRAANTGISAVIDPTGRVIQYLSLGREGVFDSTLPTALPPTLYVRWGDSIFMVLMALSAAFLLGQNAFFEARKRLARRIFPLRFAAFWSLVLYTQKFLP